jgi:serine/threonine-protein kinase
MGVVVAAHHIELDEKVAIKFLLPETLNNAEAVARFAREARAAVKIKSEHVARVTDVGKLENGSPYMVMEYLEGSDLSAWLERGALLVEQAVEFVLQACEAIAEAHALGIVHRDLKPANLFVVRRPDGALSTKVLDFGISKMTSLSGSGPGDAMTKTSALMGSPLYMSPEQMQSSKSVDSRGDVWALGVILYELVTGSPPFSGDTMPELILRVIQAAPAALRDLRPDAPAGLEAVILKCLEKDRSQRFQTVGELAVALLPFGPSRSRASVERISGVLKAAGLAEGAPVVPSPSEEGADRVAASTAASWGRTTARTSRGPWGMVAIGVVAVGIGGLTLLKRQGVTTEVATPVASELPQVAAAPRPAAPEVAASAAPAGDPPTPVVGARLEAPPLASSGDPAPPIDARGSSVAKKVAPKPARSVAPPGVAPAPPRAAAPAKNVDVFDDRK